MSGRIAVLGSVLRDPSLRRITTAFLAYAIGEWATWVAVVIYAFGRGGAAEAGLVAFIQLVPTLVIAPISGTIGDRFPRARVLVGGYLVQSIAMAATAIALWTAAPALVVYLFATLTATAITVTRPAQTALLPDVCETPEKLTASNVTAGTAEAAGVLLGPAIAGVLVGVGGPALVFAAASLGLLLATLAVLPLLRAALARPFRPPPQEELDAGILHVASRGIAELAGDPRLRAIVGIYAAAALLLGMLDIFYAVLAIDVLGLDESAIGYLGAVTGVGMLVGGTSAMTLVGRARLGGPILAAAIVFGGAVALIGLAPGVAVVVALLVFAGLGWQFVSIGILTMTQRIATPSVHGRVFGVYEALLQGGAAFGGLAVPVLIAIAGTTGAFVVGGLMVPVVTLLAARSLLAADRTAILRRDELRMLRASPLFAPLSAPVLESLAAALRTETHPAGTDIVRQGDPGDRYYLLEGGAVRVEIDGRLVQTLGPGDGFGEIALLRDVPRTATVRAIDDVEVYSLAREPFLEALTGVPASRAAAEAVVEQRLAAGS
jgi:MFS family permease